MKNRRVEFTTEAEDLVIVADIGKDHVKLDIRGPENRAIVLVLTLEESRELGDELLKRVYTGQGRGVGGAPFLPPLPLHRPDWVDEVVEG